MSLCARAGIEKTKADVVNVCSMVCFLLGQKCNNWVSLCVRAGIEKSKADVVNVVHIGEGTLAKRVKEFVLTSSGGLTVEEFEARSREWDTEARATLSIGAPAPSARGSCTHLGELSRLPEMSCSL